MFLSNSLSYRGLSVLGRSQGIAAGSQVEPAIHFVGGLGHFVLYRRREGLKAAL